MPGVLLNLQCSFLHFISWGPPTTWNTIHCGKTAWPGLCLVAHCGFQHGMQLFVHHKSYCSLFMIVCQPHNLCLWYLYHSVIFAVINHRIVTGHLHNVGSGSLPLIVVLDKVQGLLLIGKIHCATNGDGGVCEFANNDYFVLHDISGCERVESNHLPPAYETGEMPFLYAAAIIYHRETHYIQLKGTLWNATHTCEPAAMCFTMVPKVEITP